MSLLVVADGVDTLAHEAHSRRIRVKAGGKVDRWTLARVSIFRKLLPPEATISRAVSILSDKAQIAPSRTRVIDKASATRRAKGSNKNARALIRLLLHRDAPLYTRAVLIFN